MLDVALARFEHEEMLRRELAQARSQLPDRKVVDRAKGLLMQRHQIAREPRGLRAAAQGGDGQGPANLADVAQRIVDAADLLM